jgi:hypothetical protein
VTPRDAFFHRTFPHSAVFRELNGASRGMPLYRKVRNRELWGCRTSMVKREKVFSRDCNRRIPYYYRNAGLQNH